LKAIDIFLILLLFYGAYRGYKKGLLVEILTFLALIIAIISAFKLLHTGIEWLSPQDKESNKLLPYFAFIIVFIMVFIGVFFLSKLIKKVLDYTLLGKFDSMAGAIFGMCKVAFGVSLLLWLSHYAKINLPSDTIRGSLLYPKLLPFAPNVIKWVSYVIPFQDIFPLIKNTLQG
jgi:membrane protein required for colicin V production